MLQQWADACRPGPALLLHLALISVRSVPDPLIRPAAQVLRELQAAVWARLSTAESAAKLLGIARHLASRAPLPTHHLQQDSADYVVEWLDLSVRPP